MKKLTIPISTLLAINIIACGSVRPSKEAAPGAAAITDTATVTATDTTTVTATDTTTVTATVTATSTVTSTTPITTTVPAGTCSKLYDGSGCTPVPMPLPYVPSVLYPAAVGPDPLANLCLAAFSAAGIPVPAGIAAKTLQLGVSVLDIGFGVADMATTALPVLTVVKSVNILSTSRMLLLNQNAYYCFVKTVNVLSNLVVQRGCHAKFTGFALNIDILSTSNYQNGLNVNVLSNVTELPCVP